MTTDNAQASAPWRASSPPAPDMIGVGEGSSTDVIPRLWAERMLGELRAKHEAMWTRLLGHASTGTRED